MRSTSTFSVLFWVHSTRIDKNNSATIYIRVTINKKRVSISLKQKINLNSLDTKRQRVKGTGRTSQTINNYLDEVKSELVNAYRDLKAESKVISPQLIKARFLDDN